MGLKSEQRYQKRFDAVSAVQRGDEPKLVARVMNIPQNTLYDWLSRYRNGGWHRLRDGSKSGRPKKVSGDVLKWLYEAITTGDPRQHQFEFCLWSLGIIKQMLKKVHGIELSKASISRLLKQIGLSAQRPIYKAYQQDPVQVKQWLEQTYPGILSEVKKRKATLYFSYEAAFRSDSHSGTTWGKIGETPIVEEHRGKFGVNCISAISAKGVMRFKCFTGRMNSEKFIEFIDGLRKDSKRPVYVVVDGARYHTSKKVHDYLEEMKGKVKIFQLPAYSPQS